MNILKKILLLTGMMHLSLGAVTSVTPGTGVWTIAAQDVQTSNTIQTQVNNLSSEFDNFIGTFTVLDAILKKEIAIESNAELLSSDLDGVIISGKETSSKLTLISSELDQIDATGFARSFTALEGLKKVLCSKIEDINNVLLSPESQIAVVEQSAIDNAQAIESKLDQLNHDVRSLNATIDPIVNIDTASACSSLNFIQSGLNTISSKLNVLNEDLTIGFNGTFTALDLNLEKSCTIESLVDEISVVAMIDMSNVFTALNQLEDTVDTIDSRVDTLDSSGTTTVLSLVDDLNSELDISLSKICQIQSTVNKFSTNAITSFIENVFQLDNDKSILDVLLQNELISKVCNIDSAMDSINSLSSEQLSKIECIDSITDNIQSTLCDIVESPALSKLDDIDSQLDEVQDAAKNIESFIDSALQLSFDQIPVASQLESKLAQLVMQTSKVPGLGSLNDSLETSIDKLNTICGFNISSLTEVIFDQVQALSSIDTISSDALSSKLGIVDQLSNQIITNMGRVDTLINSANDTAQGLEQDFVSTWTILDAIEEKEDASLFELKKADSKLDQIEPLNFSGTFTLIDAIEQKTCNSDSLLDNLISLIEDVEFSGVYTALDALESKVCDIEPVSASLIDDVEMLTQRLGTPISNAQVAAGVTINTRGRYYLKEDGTNTTGDAITIATSDVFLDLNQYTLEATAGSAVVVNSGLNNIFVTNGRIQNTSSEAVNVQSPSQQLVLKDLDIDTTTGGSTSHGISLNTADNVVIDNVRVTNAGGDGLRVDGGSNLLVRSSGFNENGADGISCLNNFDNGCFKELELLSNAANGADCDTVTNIVFDHIKVIQNTNNGFNLFNQCSGMIIDACIAQWNVIGVHLGSSSVIQNIVQKNIITDETGAGIELNGSNNSVLFNSLTANGGFNVDEQAGINTYLGNFTFDCDGNNFNTAGSSLSGKNVQVTQTTAFNNIPTEWNNIAMQRAPSAESLVDRVLKKACTVESSIDVTDSIQDQILAKYDDAQSDVESANSVIDNLSPAVDSSALDAAATTLSSDVSAIEAELASTLSSLNGLTACEGTPITAADINPGGFTISTSGIYYLADNVDYDSGANPAITIDVDGVTLNLNNRTLRRTGGTGSGIQINTARTRVDIFNGTIANASGSGIEVAAGGSSEQLIFQNIRIIDTAGAGLNINDVIESCRFNNIFITGSSSDNMSVIGGSTEVSITNCLFADGGTRGLDLLGNCFSFCVENCAVFNNGSDGIRANGQELVFVNCKCAQNGANGILFTSAMNSVVRESICIGNTTDGIQLNAASDNVVFANVSSNNGRNGIFLDGTTDNANILENVMINNSTMNFDDSSGNTSSVLGNFAYNPSAHGNNFGGGLPANTIIEAATGATFSSRPTRWHNLSMIN